MNFTKRDETKLRVLCTIISQKFIEESMYAACLPATLIFCDEARKLGYKPQIVMGRLGHNNISVDSILHFCTKIDGREYDPTLLMFKTYSGSSAEGFAFTEIPDCEIFSGHRTEEELRMIEYYKQFKQTESVDHYFGEAPRNLRKIKNHIHQRVKKILIK